MADYPMERTDAVAPEVAEGLAVVARIVAIELVLNLTVCYQDKPRYTRQHPLYTWSLRPSDTDGLAR